MLSSHYTEDKPNNMVLIDCGIVIVDGPEMEHYWERYEVLFAQVDNVMDVWEHNFFRREFRWNVDNFRKSMVVCAELMEFHVKLTGIKNDLSQRTYQTRSIEDALSTFNCLLEMTEETSEEIFNIFNELSDVRL